MIKNENIGKVIELALNKGCKVYEQEPLSKYTTFKIGGKADAVIVVENANAMSELAAKCAELNVPNFVIGNGSNLLVSDDGYNGIVFKLDGDFRQISIADENTIQCGAGTTLAKLCKFALEHHLSGLEFAWGIPGSVGGAVYMNAGAYNGEMKNVVVSSSYIAPDGTPGTFSAENMKFSYRHSVYCENKYIITNVTIKLVPDDYESIREKMEDLMGRRKSKQPLEYPSAGSVFKRPGEKIYAGGLIEECQLKGTQIGGAQVSEKHAGFIINKGNATCEDVCKLIKHIQDTVYNKKGINLECEVMRIGNPTAF